MQAALGQRLRLPPPPGPGLRLHEVECGTMATGCCTTEPEGRSAAGLVECTLEAGAAERPPIVRGETRAARLQRALRALTPADCAVSAAARLGLPAL